MYQGKSNIDRTFFTQLAFRFPRYLYTPSLVHFPVILHREQKIRISKKPIESTNSLETMHLPHSYIRLFEISAHTTRSNFSSNTTTFHENPPLPCSRHSNKSTANATRKYNTSVSVTKVVATSIDPGVMHKPG